MPLPELELIARIRRSAAGVRGSRGFGELLKSIGDDCAVLRASAREDLLVTTDLSLEGVHFRRDWHSAETAGHRCFARGLSDIAAMSGEPIAAFLSLALPNDVLQSWVDGFVRGVLRLARRFRTPLAGGDVAESKSGIVADIIVLGRVPRGQVILRTGAKVGDIIYVTGELGGAAAVINAMRLGKRATKAVRHLLPEPRLAVGWRLRNRANSMIDLSDGLSTDLGHICDESRVGAVIAAAKLPVAAGAGLHHALHGGEDYELLFTASPGTKIPAKIAGVPVTAIGKITMQRGIWLERQAKRARLEGAGWLHFTGGRH